MTEPVLVPGLVALVDPVTGRFSDSLAPPSVAANTATAAAAATAAGSAKTAAETAATAAASAKVAAEAALAATSAINADAVTVDNLGQASNLGKTVVKAANAETMRIALDAVGRGEQVFSVKDEGATGDGATDDTAAIAAAYTKARAVNGTVLFPAGGTYVNGATINPLGTTTNGYGATLKHKPSMTAVNMYQSTGAAKFNGLTIDMNKANTTDPASLTVGIGIYLFNATSFTGAVIRDVTINNAHSPGLRIATGVAITDGASAPNCDTRVDNYRSNACKYGLLATKVGGLSLTGGRVTGAALDGIWVSLADKFSANGVTVTGSTGHGFATSYISDAQFTNNTANSNGQSGIAIGGGTVGNAVSVRFTLTGNTCRGNTQHGITIDPTITGASGVVQPMNSSITGNVCDTNGLYGLYLHNTQHVTVSGNTLTGNARGLSVDGSHTTITANTITGNTVRGISLSGNNTTAPNYGHHEVSGNTVNGNAQDYWVESVYVVETRVSVAGAGDPNGVLAVPVGSTYARTDGASGTALYVKEGGGVGSTGWTAMSSSAPRNFDVQAFTANGTWTMPVGCNFVTGVLIGGGGGAASGRRGAAGAIRCAGGAGGGGGITRFSLPASAVTSTVAVTVGAAGVGGAAVTTDDTNGNPGTSGGSSLFGLYARAWGGAFGAGGTATAGTGGAGGNGSTNGQSGASAATTGAAGTSAPASQGAGGGASGGGITAANTASNGGAGAPAVTVKTGSAATGGVVDTTSPTAADASTAGVPLPGGTAGAGASSVTTAAQPGAAGGIYGAGGSSGGASANGNNSGAGGNGAAGIVVIYSY